MEVWVLEEVYVGRFLDQTEKNLKKGGKRREKSKITEDQFTW